MRRISGTPDFSFLPEVQGNGLVRHRLCQGKRANPPAKEGKKDGKKEGSSSTESPAKTESKTSSTTPASTSDKTGGRRPPVGVRKGQVMRRLTCFIAVLFLGCGPRNEARFLSDSLNYLHILIDQVADIGQAIAGSNLDRVKSALSEAKSLENDAYEEYHISRAGTNLSERLQGIARNIDECHRLFQEGMSESLKYWDYADPDHATAGFAMLKQSMNQANAAAKEIVAVREAAR
jgi:hypothetical protein